MNKLREDNIRIEGIGTDEIGTNDTGLNDLGIENLGIEDIATGNGKSKDSRKSIGMKIFIVSIFFTLAEGVLTLIRTKVILSLYGVGLNSVVQIAIQFSAFLVLFESGVTLAYQYEMYKPLLGNNNRKISELALGLGKSLKSISIKMMLGAFVISAIYSLVLYSKGIAYLDAFMIMAVMGIRLIAPYLFVLKDKTLLLIKEKGYIVSTVQGTANCLVLGIEIFLAKQFHLPLPLLLAGSVLVVLATAPVYKFFVNREYHPNLTNQVEPDFSPSVMTKDILVHQVSSLINSNSDNMVLSFFYNLSSVTIYSAYYFVMSFPIVIWTKIITSLKPTLALKIQNNEKNAYFFYREVLSLSCFCSAWILPVYFLFGSSFVTLWIGKGYLVKPIDVFLFGLIMVRSLMMQPVYGARDARGLFKETKKFTLIQALFNISLSIVLVRPFGITGILASTIITTYLFADLLNMKIVYRVVFKKFPRIVVDYFLVFLCFGITTWIYTKYPCTDNTTWKMFFLNATKYAVVSGTVAFTLIFTLNSAFRSLIKRFLPIGRLMKSRG